VSAPLRNERRTDPMAANADEDLAAVRAAQKDPTAFGVLYRRYLDRVYSYAFYQLGDHHDAEDATARTFLAALRAIGTFRDEGAAAGLGAGPSRSRRSPILRHPTPTRRA